MANLHQTNLLQKGIPPGKAVFKKGCGNFLEYVSVFSWGCGPFAVALDGRGLREMVESVPRDAEDDGGVL